MHSRSGGIEILKIVALHRPTFSSRGRRVKKLRRAAVAHWQQRDESFYKGFFGLVCVEHAVQGGPIVDACRAGA